jgi:hypothetical protein
VTYFNPGNIQKGAMLMALSNSLCRQFANLLGGTSAIVDGVCTVTRLRSNLTPLIRNKRSRSALALAATFSFEDLDRSGRALNLGEFRLNGLRYAIGG